jgi:hypothetical protein
MCSDECRLRALAIRQTHLEALHLLVGEIQERSKQQSAKTSTGKEGVPGLRHKHRRQHKQKIAMMVHGVLKSAATLGDLSSYQLIQGQRDEVH